MGSFHDLREVIDEDGDVIGVLSALDIVWGSLCCSL